MTGANKSKETAAYAITMMIVYVQTSKKESGQNERTQTNKKTMPNMRQTPPTQKRRQNKLLPNPPTRKPRRPTNNQRKTKHHGETKMIHQCEATGCLSLQTIQIIYGSTGKTVWRCSEHLNLPEDYRGKKGE